MHSLTLQPDNRAQVAARIAEDRLVVACLCAAWCGTCGSYRDAFERLAASHPDKLFVWIDIEDNADVMGELDVENFPTLLLQRGDAVAFFGTVLPDPGVADRLIRAQAGQQADDILRLAAGHPERAAWQRDCNLRVLLGQP